MKTETSNKPWDYALSEQAKAIGPAGVALVIYVITGLQTGDWTLGDTAAAGLATLLTYGAAFYLPNRPAGS